MFNIKLLILFIFIFKIQINEISNEESFGTECLIHNREYSFEYLYSTNNFDLDQILSRNVYTRPIAKINKLDKMRWNITKAIDTNAFYLRNNMYGKYLCASDTHDDLFNLRRIVQIMKISENSTIEFKNCQWKLEKVSSKSRSRVYSIQNIKYQEQLYASSPFFTGKFINRVIYLWYRPTNSKQAKWIIDCFTDDYYI